MTRWTLLIASAVLAGALATIALVYAASAIAKPPTPAQARAYLEPMIETAHRDGFNHGGRVIRCTPAPRVIRGRRGLSCKVIEYRVTMLENPREISAGGFVVRDHVHHARVWRRNGELRDDSPYLWPNRRPLP